jgi:apolipoprotein N-acyltransferase
MRIPLLFLWLLSGLLLGASFVTPHLWWTFTPGMVCLLYSIKREQTYTKVFFLSVLVGTLRYCGALLWWFNTLPLSWIRADQMLLQFGAVTLYWLLTATVLGLAVGLFGLLVKRIEIHTWQLLLLTPTAWVASEIFASFLFSIYSLGAGSTINTDFSFGYVGYLLAQSHLLIGFASLFGVYGLSHIAILLSTTIFVFLNNSKYSTKKAFCIIAIIFLCSWLIPSLFIHQQSQAGEKVVAVETYFDKKLQTKENGFEVRRIALLGAMEYALYHNPDVIILPEDSRFTELFTSTDELFNWIQEKNKNFGGIIIDSGRIINTPTNDVILRASLYDTADKTVSQIDKHYLVPHGEFLPYLQKKILGRFLSLQTVASIEKSLEYRQGSLFDSSALPKKLPALLFCFESVSPLGVRHALQARHPSFVAHIVSHAWFEKPTSFWYQLDSMLQVQAVWNNTPIISAGNMSPSKLYLPTGKIEAGKNLEHGYRWKLIEYVL